jgi:hypothetical protein
MYKIMISDIGHLRNKKIVTFSFCYTFPVFLYSEVYFITKSSFYAIFISQDIPVLND